MKKSGAPPTPALTDAERLRGERKSQFLALFRIKRFISVAIEAMPENIRVNRDTIAEWRRSDPVFAREFEAIEQDTTELYERSLAAVGLDPKHPQMVHAATVVLKARNPGKYTERLRVEQENTRVEAALEELRGLILRKLTDVCPHCKTKLAMKKELAQELVYLSERMREAKQ